MRRIIGLVLLLLQVAAWAAPDPGPLVNKTFTRGRDEFKNGDWKSAIRDLEVVHKAAPTHLPTLLMLGIAYRTDQDYPHAEAAFKEAIKVSPHFTQGYVQLADLYLTQQRYSDARAQVKAILGYEPQNFQAHYVLGVVAYQQGLLGEAITEWQNTLRIYEDFAPARFNLGWALYQQHSYSQAEAHLQRAVALKAHNPQYEFGLGYVCWAAQDTARASNAFQLVRTDGGGTSYALAADAFLALQSKNLDVAIEKAKMVTVKTPEMTEGWLILAQALQQKGDLTNARLAADQAFKDDPNSFEAIALRKTLPAVVPPTPGWTTPSSSPAPGWVR